MKLPVKIAEGIDIIEVCQKPGIVLLIFSRSFRWAFNIFIFLFRAKTNAFANKLTNVFNGDLAFIINIHKVIFWNWVKQFQTRLEDVISKVDYAVIVIIVELFLFSGRFEAFYQDWFLKFSEVALQLLGK